MRSNGICMMVILFTSVVLVCGQGATHLVGGLYYGWDLCNSDLQDWVSRTTFTVNDVLEFSYILYCNDVVEVTKEDYDTCTITNALVTYPVNYTTVILLTGPGTRYFINGRRMNQCQKCLKLQVEVVANATGSDVDDQNPGCHRFGGCDDEGDDYDQSCQYCACPDKSPPAPSPMAFLPPAPFLPPAFS